ncbi:MAG: glycosyltransferase [Defluviitaleaceae bacterium]|nr:glycosyltransferase [Defluviitaleaceae bacterium]
MGNKSGKQMFSQTYIETDVCNLVVYCGQSVSGLCETISSLHSDADVINIIALMDVYPHELPPKEFELYLKERSKGAEFTHLSRFNFAELGAACIFVQAGQLLNQDVLEYAGYFLKDSGCPLLFVPVLGRAEVLPEDFFNLPTGSITDNLALLVKYNFICITTKPSLLQTGNYAGTLVQAAKQLGAFGVLTMSTCTGTGIARSFTARELYDAVCSVSQQAPLTELIDEFILSQVSLSPADADDDIGLLFPYFSEELFPQGPRPHIHITKVTNNFADVDIEGYFFAKSVDDNLNFASKAVDLLPITETVLDKLYPRFYFRCTHTLKNMKARAAFECGGKMVKSIFLAEDCAGNYSVLVKGNNLELEKLAPRPEYMVTCIIPVHNGEKHLKEAIESVIHGSLDFFKHVQIILVNDGSTDETHSICSSYTGRYRYNILYIQQKHSGASAARTVGMRHAMGKYIVFLDADDTFDRNLLQLGAEQLDNKKNKNIDFIAFPIKMHGIENPPHPDLDFRFKENGLIDIGKEPEKVQFSACGVLMRKNAIKGLAFNRDLTVGEDAEFMCRALADKQQYLVCKDAFYNYRVSRSRYTTAYRESVKLAEALVSFYRDKSEDITVYAQNVIMHNIRRIVLGGTPAPVSSADTTKQDEAITALAKALSYIDDEVIANARKFSREQREYMLYIKHGSIAVFGGGFFAGKCRIRAFTADTYIDYIRERHGNLVIAGYFHLPDYDAIELVAMHGEREYFAAIGLDNRLAVTVCDRQVSSARSFEIRIPLVDVLDGGSLAIRIKYGNTYGTTGIITSNNFMFVGKAVIAYPHAGGLKLTAATPHRISEALGAYKGRKDIIKEYLDAYPLLSTIRIWLFVDSADSKGGLDQSAVSHMYKYCEGIDDGVDKRIVLSQSELALHDYDDNSIVYDSEIYLLMCMFAEKIFVSDVAEIARIRNQVGLMTAEFIFLPNDVLTPQDRPMLTGLIGAPLELVSLISETERALLPHGPVSDAAHVLGNPRYDSLTDNKQPRILFMPSYREHLYLGANEFNPAFKYSEYVTRVGDLLLEEHFLDAADAHGISVDFAPHEKVSLQRSDFEMDESVKIIPPAFPRLLLCQNAEMLITDTLPAHGFAYLGKPVIYYQFDSDGTLPQDGARFGESVNDFESLVQLLVEYMRNGFALKQKYSAEGDGFFAHRDGRSCQRVYKALTALPHMQ